MSHEQTHATILTDLSFGDAGKGTTTEFLSSISPSSAVIRFNGGGQAEHNIVIPDGRHHTFSQFGASSFIPEVATHLSRDMLINPMTMSNEANHLIELGVGDIWQRTTVDEDAQIVTPYHVAGNRLRELARGAQRHGSTGQGISEAVMDGMFRPDLTIRASDILSGDIVAKLDAHREYKREQMAAFGRLLDTDTEDWHALHDDRLSDHYGQLYDDWADRVRIVARDYLGELTTRYHHLIFEPAQGILLDEKRGFHPHTTWSNTTPDNARRLLEDIQFEGDITTLGIVRAYTTRHGDGPFVTEDPALDEPLYEYFNGTGPWQGHFRIGHFDAVAHRYAARAAGQLDGLVVTGIDRVLGMDKWNYASGYDVPHENDAANYFELDDEGMATDIRLSRYGDKLHMSRLTQLLKNATPIYQHLERYSSADIVSTIERQLGKRVVLASYGPTLLDKKILDDSVVLG